VKTLAFYHQKGGTGKTTLAIASALALTDAGRRVLLLDTDPQGTAAAWGGRYGDGLGVSVRAQAGEGLDQALARFRGQFDWCLLDCAPTVSDLTLRVLGLADGLVVPLRPAPPDLWALESVALLVADRRRAGPLAVRLLVNQHRGEDLRCVRAAAAELGLDLFERPIPQGPGVVGLFSGGSLPTDTAEVLSTLMRVFE